MEQGNNYSQRLTKITPQAYALLEEEAKKTLDTLSENQIWNIRRIAWGELKAFLDYLSLHEKKEKLTIKSCNVYMETKGKELTKSIIKNKKFWLSQLINFIAVAVFKIPGEFTPTFSFGGFNRRGRVTVKQYLDKMISVCTLAVKTVSYLIPFIEKIIDDIRSDDLRLIVFANSLYKNRAYLPDIEQKCKDAIKSILHDNGYEYSSAMIDNGVRIPEIGDVISKVCSYYMSVLPDKNNHDT